MPDNFSQAIAQSWTVPFAPTLAVIVAAVLYLRGWRLARATRPLELPPWRAASFLLGLALFWLALASPLDALGEFLLTAHMTQHLILMSFAPPLIVLGAPTVPMLRGLPRAWVRDDFAPWMNTAAFHKVQSFLTHPAFAWITMNAAFLGWHLPPAYELALRSPGWHEVEHACFFSTSILFWWFVLEPWPSRNTVSRWLVIPYLMGADLLNTGLSAFLAFGDRIAYPTYAAVPRLFNTTAMNDQIAAGAEMWVFGSMVFWIPLIGTVVQLLSPKRRRLARQQQQTAAARRPLPRPVDLLRLPVLGHLLRWRYGRTSLQVISAAIMGITIWAGFHGSSMSSMNVAGAGVWNIVRPVGLVLILLTANFFCMACPFTLPRELARKLGIAKLRWPQWLRRKWIAAGLLILFFWAYEQLALWDSPRATAILLLAYIGTALLVDSIFTGGSFCKYVCPIGQFNFAASTLAPVELGMRSKAVCDSCSTSDCINGNQKQRGCELELYMPTKIGNMDCTLCMDCVKACPHDNIGLTILSPARELGRDPQRSSLGRISSRVDVAAIALVLTLAAPINAAYMIGPVTSRLDPFEQAHPFAGSNFGSLLFTFALSALALGLAWLTAKLLQSFTRERLRTIFCRFALAMLPLGLAMWVAHLGFHFAMEMPSIPMVAQATWADLGHHAYNMALMNGMGGMGSSSKPANILLMGGAHGLSLLSLQVLILDLGLLLALYAGWKTARELRSSEASGRWLIGLYAVLAFALYAACVWIFTQPMEMRGMGM
ncbi:cytochrome c oxidase assembly protein [Silvibacterium sp.]|uniref:cytochrome c oxidase assembly protein n=1 Tax=Silvibacterium sp. TaxID=1964179 RepID=UPI0039E29466